MSAALDAWRTIANSSNGREILNMSRFTLRLLVDEAAATAELEALKARRCDGCAAWRPQQQIVGECGLLSAQCVQGPVTTLPHFACAAWTEKPHMMTGIWPSRAGEGTHDLADDAWTEKP